MPRLFILNESTSVSASQLAQGAAAVAAQIENDAGPAWGWPDARVTSSSNPTDPSPSDWLLRLTDTSDPGDLGWHSDDGQPFGVICVPEILQGGGGVLLNGPQNAPGVFSVVSHEVVETFGDPPASIWSPAATPPDDVAFELCDPVQGYSYQTAGCPGVDLSDFVLPAFFDPKAATGPWDRMGFLTAPLSLGDGGYWILKAPDGTTQSIFGRATAAYWRSRAGSKGGRYLRK
jgi:hypothetical protein